MPLALRRQGLVDQAAAALRAELDRGAWRAGLPGEHALAAALQVGRSTVRQALRLLRREGRLQVRQGSRWRPRRAAARVRTARSAAGPEVVAMISALPDAQQSWSSILIRDELRAQLQRAGLELRTHVLAQRAPDGGGAALRRLRAHTGAAAWVLASCSEAVQRHFERSGEPALVLGSPHPGVALPAFRIDLGAALRHALGVLQRLGHRRIALLLPRAPFAGTRDVAASLAAAQEWLRGRGVEVAVRHHESSTAGVGAAVSGLLASAAPPTALVAMLPGDALSALGHLQARGVRVPEAMSLIGLFDDPYLTRLTPAPARYACDPAAFVRRLARPLVRLARSGVRPASVAVVPEFIRGGTLHPPPASGRAEPA